MPDRVFLEYLNLGLQGHPANFSEFVNLAMERLFSLSRFPHRQLGSAHKRLVQDRQWHSLRICAHYVDEFSRFSDPDTAADYVDKFKEEVSRGFKTQAGEISDTTIVELRLTKLCTDTEMDTAQNNVAYESLERIIKYSSRLANQNQGHPAVYATNFRCVFSLEKYLLEFCQDLRDIHPILRSGLRATDLTVSFKPGLKRCADLAP